MQPLVTAAEMRALDRVTIDEIGVPAAVLMEHAGRAVADAVIARAAPGAVVAVLCGGGNNGGDGFVCARWLRERGLDATVWLARGRPKSPESILHLRAYEKLGGPVREVADPAAAVAGAGVIVDALLGTGLETDVAAPLAALIEAVNRAPGLTVAVDVPSGLSSDDGRTLGVAIEADVTVTLGLAKLGLVTHPGSERTGELVVADIGIPARLASPRAFLLEEADARALVPVRAAGAHKGTNGHALIVAGSEHKLGAALLAATGALRGGAGLVTLAVPPAALGGALGRVPEVMLTPFDPEAGGALEALRALAGGKRAVVIGPGMPVSPAARALVRGLAATLEVPLVLDADALNQLEATPLAGPRVLTPHPGEAGRLLGLETAAVQADRVGAARRLGADNGDVVLLKGARTVVAAADGTVSLNPTGNPGLATGGTGDVLAGLTGALLAQGLTPLAAARLAAYVHGRAADLLAAEHGPIGLAAGDVAAALPRAFASLASPAGQPGNGTRVAPATAT